MKTLADRIETVGPPLCARFYKEIPGALRGPTELTKEREQTALLSRRFYKETAPAPKPAIDLLRMTKGFGRETKALAIWGTSILCLPIILDNN
jgi:hypothetical protein